MGFSAGSASRFVIKVRSKKMDDTHTFMEFKVEFRFHSVKKKRSCKTLMQFTCLTIFTSYGDSMHQFFNNPFAEFP